jgi:hypothetical protein
MARAANVRRIALSLAGTVEMPHFDRTAFKVKHATLAADRRTLNVKLTPEEQELKCLVAPELFSPVLNAWGRRGWTTLQLGAARAADLRAALGTAWRHALPAKRPRRTIENGESYVAAASFPYIPMSRAASGAWGMQFE